MDIGVEALVDSVTVLDEMAAEMEILLVKMNPDSFWVWFFLHDFSGSDVREEKIGVGDGFSGVVVEGRVGTSFLEFLKLFECGFHY